MSTDFTKRSQKYSKDKSPLNSRPQKHPPVKTIPIVLHHALPCPAREACHSKPRYARQKSQDMRLTFLTKAERARNR